MKYDRLIFVYNADGGVMSGIMDSVHKTVSPDTYSCSLCAITHGVFRMNPKWRAWLKALTMPVAFYHRDDLAPRYANHVVALPAVLGERGGAVHILLAATELDGLPDVDALISAIEPKLNLT